MKGKFRIVAEPTIEFQITPGEPDSMECATPSIEITFDWTPGARATWTDPGYGDEVHIRGFRLIDGDGLSPTAEQLSAWVDDWYDDGGYDACCREAKGAIADARAEAAERRRDWMREQKP